MVKKVLIAGESWMSYTTHVKGFDTFYTTVYEEGVGFIKKAIENAGYEVDYIPNHLAPEKFPTTMEEIKEYSCVILSDIGSNTLLLPHKTFTKSIRTPNRCDLIKDYVKDGGTFLMIGGYMSFTGIDAKTRYGQTSIKDILPVKCLDMDDRAEHPEGIVPVTVREHDALKGLPAEWPHFLGYNKTIAIPEGEVLATIGGDPFIAVGNFGKGKSAVFTSDCAPHWGPPEFVNWEFYDELWKGILDYLTK
ncbi:glutamine amidotransferase [Tissierella praeacuta]|uniref:glutamine amidotransferase n=1 Tax=Tissierella praeacuta TaxID=43131 RepID=UPI000EEE11EF|nr:glutamine amidotransferase [Tissierella praeacuta]MBU5256785.1 cytoplasmic protein [Tissierella praeacuta]HAE92212.1 cytoplasmic protein [Tissierella sp.]